MRQSSPPIHDLGSRIHRIGRNEARRWGQELEPLPETDEALDEYLEEDDSDLRARLLEMGREAVSLVPSCVGLSLGLVKDGLTFTLTATSQEVAVIDAAQYLDGGPCVAVAAGSEALHVEIPDLLDEKRWSAFALTSAAHGVKSTLSLPILREDALVGGINLYAAALHAFDDKHVALASALGASAEGAVTDADLEFTSRARALQTPARMADRREIEFATAILAARDHTNVDVARSRLQDSALRAGLTLLQAARVVTYLGTHPD